VESKFREKAIISQRRWFDLLLTALPEKVLDQVMDVVDSVPEDFSCDTLKSHLLESHTLSIHEKLEVLNESEPLGGRKPSQMRPACWPTVLLAWNRPSRSSSCSYSGCLLHCRHCLGNRNQGTSEAWRPERTGCKPLTDRSPMSSRPRLQQSRRRSLSRRRKVCWKKPRGWQQANGGGQAAAASGSGSGSSSGGLTHSEQARVGSGLCYFHWTHGARASKCVDPCSWTGN
jgi:hypothetical protein